ncbi:subtilisin Carlsberg [Plectosphaerella cucumerina]|jgi:subtilisin family serine protease|uniref:Subtilisin Carlsberg n=1 Tax=Plectosphaerella cucumerina TaxID=40658 RepID=A0A8K0TLK2_9PEZI|nr:subtilisin Carlsberg [Plectosphaerella cucumerina]
MLPPVALRLLAAAGLVLAAELPPVRPSSYIVEYKQGVTKRDAIFARHANIKVARDYQTDIFNGANIEADEHSLTELEALPEVAKVWPNRYFEATRAIVKERQADDNSTGPLPPGSDLDPAVYDVHRSTGVRELHEKGIKGKGAKVGVVDTGVDYTHPDLGGGFGPGFKVAGGYDFAGDGDWPGRGNIAREPDEDPMGNQDHGTHVAGIVAGQGKGWSGVAPEATIYAYKIFAHEGTDEAITIDAFLRAYEDGMDIITASIGLKIGWAEGALEEVATRLADKGVIITVSVGNGGDGGPFRALSPSSAKGVIAVSNIDTPTWSEIVTPAYDTSWGLLPDLQIKPDVGAPGSYIYSTVFNHGWAAYSGTSMATPYLAGVAALYIGQYGGRHNNTRNAGTGGDFAKFMHSRLVSNVRRVHQFSWQPESVAAVAQIGTGLVNASAVLGTTTDLVYEPMALNDTRFFSRYHKLTVINNGDSPVDYSFSKVDHSGVDILGSSEFPNVVREYNLLQWNDYSVNATLPRPFTLQPGQSKEVTVSFQNPDKAGWWTPALPLYGGTIVVSGSNGDSLRVPFSGVAGDLKKTFQKNMFLETPTMQSLDPRVPVGVNGSIPSFSFNLTNQEFPIIFAGNAWSTRQLRYDIFEKGWTERSWTWPLVPGKNGYVGSATSWVGAGQVPKWFDDQGWNPDETTDYPRVNTGRAGSMASSTKSEYWWFGKLTDGTKIPQGEYVLRFAALVPFGRPEASDNWDAWTTPFKVTGQYAS